MGIHSRSIGQIALAIKQASEWFADNVNISIGDSRLEKINDFVFHQLLDSGTSVGKKFQEGEADKNAYYALSDGVGFGLIASEMDKLPSHLIPRQTLKDILKGPLVVSDEIAGETTDPRNKFVELELAANLSSSGFEIIGFDDVKFRFENTNYLVECKRPFSNKNLESNIEKAYYKLRKSLEGNGSRGIIAIAVDKVFELDKGFLEIETLSSISEPAYIYAKKFRDRVAKFESQWIDPRIVGILAIIRYVAKKKDKGEVVSSYTFAMVKIASPRTLQAAESEKLDRMIKELQLKY